MPQAHNLNILELITSRKLIMVGGKGGVGKTTTASAIAVAAANQGRRVLLISTDPAHSLADAFDRAIGGQVTRMAPNLDALELDPDTEAEAYMDRVMQQMRRFAGPDQINELQRQLRLGAQSPGAQEAAILERMATLIEDSENNYDLLIFDTAPTGHTLRLLTLPEIMAAWTDGLLKHNKRSEKLGKALAHLTPGRSVDNPLKSPEENPVEGMDQRGQELTETLLRRQRLFQRTRRRLNDTNHTAFVFVMTPEKLPILETGRAIEALASANIPVAGVIVNRIMPDTANSPFWQARVERQSRHLQEIDDLLKNLPQKRLPLMEDDVSGLEALTRFASLMTPVVGSSLLTPGND
ncbi:MULTISPECIES: ArsA family ATPase [unclassified Marinobacter]|uniref:ArsA family ATPase n=1 Tax=unclassified Marinobacter TaxID=83889 RepID=UPI0019055735|nr:MULTISPECIES: ArsA family ATPase [unclassified Marinobacter]MBK1872872.1 ArsA family ATPase [Marinobacter sp. 1-3A]MBK1886947.1 ArsA family ATPase [Marinobacter sp. DY40_1A1]